MSATSTTSSLYLKLSPDTEYSRKDLMSIWKLSYTAAINQIDKMVKMEMMVLSNERPASRSGNNEKFYMRVEDKIQLPGLFYQIINNRLSKLHDKSSQDDWGKEDASEFKILADICKDLEITNKALTEAKKILDEDKEEDYTIEDALKLVSMK